MITFDHISAKLTAFSEILGDIERDYEAKKASADHEKMVSSYASVSASLDGIEGNLNSIIALAESARTLLAAL